MAHRSSRIALHATFTILLVIACSGSEPATRSPTAPTSLPVTAGGSASLSLAIAGGPVVRDRLSLGVLGSEPFVSGARVRFRLSPADGDRDPHLVAGEISASDPTRASVELSVGELLASGAMAPGVCSATVEVEQADGSRLESDAVVVRLARPLEAPRVMYDHDLTHAVREGAGSGVDVEARIASTIEELRARSGVDTVVVAAGLGEVPVWDSQYYPLRVHAELWRERTGRAPPSDALLTGEVLAGGDPLGAARRASSAGEVHPLRFYVSLRMNDKHFTHVPGHYDAYTATIRVPSRHVFETVSRFLWSDLDRRISLERHRGDTAAMDPSLFGSGYHVLLDYAKPGVLEHKSALIRDLVRAQDMDGLVLDFMRVPHLFNQRDTTRSQRVAIMTRLIADARAALDLRAASREHPIALAVRIPYLPEARSRLGIDIAAWALAGVDVFVLGFERDWSQPFFYHGDRIVDFTEVRRLGGDVRAYQEINYATQVRRVLLADCTRSVPVTYRTHERCWVDEGARRCDRIEAATYAEASRTYDARRRTTRSQMISGAHAAYARGADGVYLFNMPYYRGGDGPDPERRVDPPFDAMQCLGEPSCVARAAAPHYFLARQFELDYQELDGSYPLPAEVPGAGEALAIALFTPAPAGGFPETMRLDVELESRPTGDLVASLGGRRLEAASPAPPRRATGHRCAIAEPERRLTFIVPGGSITDGRNELTFERSGRENSPLRIERLDLNAP